jgi:hypothetical protein
MSRVVAGNCGRARKEPEAHEHLATGAAMARELNMQGALPETDASLP